MTRAPSATVRRLQRRMDELSAAAILRMDETLPWYRRMAAENRSWVNLVAQAGIAQFVEWMRQSGAKGTISADVFGIAPRELARVVTLQQTVELVRVVLQVVEERIDDIAAPGGSTALREGVLRYSREVAFAAARVYAQAAESRGAWDARLEALVVDALLRGEVDDSVRSRAAALGWHGHAGVVVAVGSTPATPTDAVVEGLRRRARSAKLDVLTGVQGDRLVAVLGGVEEPEKAALHVVDEFAPGPVVVGPLAADLLGAARSAEEALQGLSVVRAWPLAPRPVPSDELLPERAVGGDPGARRRLVEEVYVPLEQAGNALLETLATYLEQAPSFEAAARLLFVHPNTVRYRLRRVVDVTGYSPHDERQAFALRLALALGRLAAAPPPAPAPAARP
ncbi:PucR family transcriptional regulator [Vallicoccus soli]|uniref:PucR family transcriptional regulator n=1 Tax=Vallicoccus soli TaxID=2339232 RepID=A0A3A3Z5J7_9ACTN|nr:helix-turn-helix domain-containing protein [Vallicoccus soli]RJK96988.1 PucR family transcriptional regulator [Vallicoccus soli]